MVVDVVVHGFMPSDLGLAGRWLLVEVMNTGHHCEISCSSKQDRA